MTCLWQLRQVTSGRVGRLGTSRGTDASRYFAAAACRDASDTPHCVPRCVRRITLEKNEEVRLVPTAPVRTWTTTPADRDAIFGFPAHGTWRQVEVATAARDVAVGEPWTFSERTMVEVIVEEMAAA